MLYAFATRPMEAVLARDVEAALEVRRSLVDLARHEVRGADHVQCERLGVGVADIAPRARALACPTRTPSALSRLSIRRYARNAYAKAELLARRQLLEDLDRLSIRVLGGGR